VTAAPTPRALSDASGRRRILGEIVLVLGLSLGASAVYSLVSIIARVTSEVALGDQVTVLNPSRSPRPWLDLTHQLLSIGFTLVPVLLAVYLLAIRPCRAPVGEAIGWDWHRRRNGPWRNGPWRGEVVPAGGRPGATRIRATLPAAGRRRRDILWGLALAAAVGLPGLAFYAVGRFLGITVAIQASALDNHWWTVPVLVLSAIRHGLIEEVIVVAYLYERTRDLGWSAAGRADWRFVAVTAVFRGSYHLYQGFGPFIGNVAMGVLFAWWFTSRWGRHRVMPLVVAHALINTVAFVGYPLMPESWRLALGFS